MILFLTRLAQNLIKLLLLSIPLQLIGALLLLALLPWYKELKLPFFLRWFDCADLYPEFNRTPETYINLVNTKSWWDRYTWIAWRNPINYFTYKYLSVKFDRPKLAYINTDKKIYEREGHLGYMHCEWDVLDGRIYEYRAVLPIGWNKCLRMRMGYKLGTLAETEIGEYAQSVFVVQIKDIKK